MSHTKQAPQHEHFTDTATAAKMKTAAAPNSARQPFIADYMRSKIPAAPMPVPTHMVTMPYFRLRRRRA